MNTFKVAARKRLQRQNQQPEDNEVHKTGVESETLLNELGEIILELEQMQSYSAQGSAALQKLKQLHHQHQQLFARRCMTGPYN